MNGDTRTRRARSRQVSSRRGRAWDEESVRVALSEFLAGWEVWPTYEQFIQGGAKGLRDALYRTGGVEYWAKEMGLPGGDRSPGGVRRWTDETIRRALADFFGDRDDWPSQREFDQSGQHALREALRHYGGPERWAKEMGVVLPPGAGRSTARPRPPATPADKPPRRWPPWDEQRIASELKAFLHGRTEWPRHREFVEAGHKQLYGAVLRNGGTHEWARRMGVKKAKRYGGQPREFGLQSAPSPTVRLARPTAKSKRSPARPARVWDDERIEKAILPLVNELGRWPTKGEFRANGAGALYSAVCRHGGTQAWRKRLVLQ